MWLEKKSPARGKGWQKRWFVFDRYGKVQYFAQQADEQAHGIAKDRGDRSEERLKGEFSLRDCARISTPKRELSILVYCHQPTILDLDPTLSSPGSPTTCSTACLDA